VRLRKQFTEVFRLIWAEVKKNPLILTLPGAVLFWVDRRHGSS